MKQSNPEELNLRILVITHEYPPVGGGGGKVAQDLSRGFVQNGHHVQVITAHFGDLEAKKDEQGVIIHRLRSLRRKPYQASFLAMLGFVIVASFKTLKIIHTWKPDIIHVHFAVPAGPIAWLANRITKVPYVLTVHLGDIPGGTPNKTDRWFKFIFPFTPPIWRAADQVVAVSAFTKGLARKKYDVPVSVIHNGIRLGHRPAQEQLADPIEIVFAGRMIEQKDPVQVIRILALCKQFDWHCTMFGDGPLKEQVEAQIKQENLESRFWLPGWQSTEEVQDHLLKSDILIMPSLSEGLSVIGVQALASGLCLVVSKIGGFLELVDENENGFLMPTDEIEPWANSIQFLLTHPEKLMQMKNHSLKKASDFDLDTIVQSYLCLFQKVIQK